MRGLKPFIDLSSTNESFFYRGNLSKFAFGKKAVLYSLEHLQINTEEIPH